MTKSLTAVLLALVLGQGLSSASAETGVLAPGAKLEKLAGDFEFTEGPACDAEGNVFFTDQPNDRILKWSIDGKLSTFMQPCGPVQRPVLRRQGQSLGLRRREERAVAHRPGGQGHRGGEGLPGQAAQRPQRRLGPARTAGSTSPTPSTSGPTGSAAQGAGPSASTTSPPDHKTLAARDRRPEAAQRHHRHARRQDALRGRHRRGQDLRLRHPARRHAHRQDARSASMGSDGMTIDERGQRLPDRATA